MHLRLRKLFYSQKFDISAFSLRLQLNTRTVVVILIADCRRYDFELKFLRQLLRSQLLYLRNPLPFLYRNKLYYQILYHFQSELMNYNPYNFLLNNCKNIHSCHRFLSNKNKYNRFPLLQKDKYTFCRRNQ